MFQPQRVTLPGPLTVWSPSVFEASVLYREIFSERTYEKHGIAIDDGSTIFDVGANIGLFTVYAAKRFPRARVHAFEPVPEIYGVLQQNLAEHAPEARAYNFGLADKAGEAMFEFDRFATIASSMHPSVFNDGKRQNTSKAIFAEAALIDLEKVTGANEWIQIARSNLKRPVLREIVLLFLGAANLGLRLRRRAFLKHRRCELKTLSEALAISGSDVVDLVKIDVEGAEESILAGIDDEDWSRLRQFVIEVHDVAGRLDRMSRLLQNRGYRTIQAREDWAIHELLGISTLYAIRQPDSRLVR